LARSGKPDTKETKRNELSKENQII
jgi:hypothetical protein